MPVKEASPNAVGLDEAFREAMDGPAKPREVDAPPDIDPEAPLGRGDDGEPLAPYGRNKDGSVRRTNAGRRAKGDHARVGEVTRPSTPSGKGSNSQKETPEPQDYSEALGEFADAVWMGLSGVAKVGPMIPVIGKKLPTQKIGATAFCFRTQQDQLCKAVQLAADHNAGAARFCSKLATGEATWVLTAGFLAMPFFAQVGAVMRGDDALKAMNPDASVQRLADENEALLEQEMTKIKSQFEAAQAEAQAEMTVTAPSANGQAPGTA